MNWNLIIISWSVTAIVMAMLWLYQRIREDASIVDVGWAYSLGLSAILFVFLGDGDLIRRGLLGCLAGAWSVRLGTYLLVNRVIGKHEDARYVELRKQWGANAQRNFFLFFQFQALLVALFAIPYAIVASLDLGNEFGILDVAGVLVWIISVGGESIADKQLSAFRSRPDSRGRTCQEGLWKYSRHPNYFFEWLHWFAYVLIGWQSSYFFLTLIGPALMFYFLYKITGIPPTEARALQSRVDYKEYQQKTSMFIPWFPRKLKPKEGK